MRDFVFVEDVANAISIALKGINQKEEDFDTLNVGTGEATEIRVVVKVLAQIIGSRKRIWYDESTTSRPGDGHHRADTGKLQRVLRWKPKIAIGEGLRITIDGIGYDNCRN